MTIGERIKSARKQAGMTQQELAERLETSYTGISLWESDKRIPKRESLNRIAEVLNIPVAYFTECSSMSEKEVLDFVSWAWPRADYQLTAQQHSEGTQEEVERWERVCSELHRIHNEIVAKQQAEDKKRSAQAEELLELFERFNPKGKKKIIELVKEFSKIHEYQQE